VLTAEELRRLVDLGNQIERHFGSPQDIEWGIDEGQVYLLQSRPITSL
jgi:pyruvate,water dikinase